MSSAVPAFKVCSVLSYLYRAHSLCSVNKLHPLLRRAIIPGDTCLRSPQWPDAESEAPPWLPPPAGTGAANAARTQQQRVQLNAGQLAALNGIQGAVTSVQGPPGTGKSSFILETFLQRVPEDARMLACTATNKAIDSLVAKFEAAGVVDILAVGSKERMGECTQNFTLEARIARDSRVAAAAKALAAATLKRELCEERVLDAGKPSKPKKDKVTGKESNRGFVERALLKVKPDKMPCKKTPGIVRLMCMIDYKPSSDKFTNLELYAAAQTYLKQAPDEADASARSEASAAKNALKEARGVEKDAAAAYDRSVEKAKWSIWKRARLVACTAASAVHVTRRLMEAMDEEGMEESEGGTSFADLDEEEQAVPLEYVVLDEAAALLEPDALGCLLHGARALLLVGDHQQLPPFTKWQGAEREQYNVSLMERLATGKGRGAGGGRGGGGSGSAVPCFMLTHQYRMHPEIAQVLCGGCCVCVCASVLAYACVPACGVCVSASVLAYACVSPSSLPRDLPQPPSTTPRSSAPHSTTTGSSLRRPRRRSDGTRFPPTLSPYAGARSGAAIRLR